MTDTLTYLNTTVITAVKSFMGQGNITQHDTIQLLMVIYNMGNKIMCLSQIGNSALTNTLAYFNTFLITAVEGVKSDKVR